MKPAISNVDLFVTEECNLDCKYCFHPKGAQTLTIDNMKKIVDKLAILCAKKITLNFWGGEPLLYPEVVIKTIEYASKFWHKDNFRPTLVTNGTIYDNDLFKTLKKHNVEIQVSLDGDADTNEKVRGKTQLVADNIKRILTNFPNTSVRMTYLPENVHRLVQNILFIKNLGVKRVMHQAAIEEDWNNEAVKTYAEQMETLFKMRLKHADLGVSFVDKGLNICDDKQRIDLGYCGAGRELIAVLPDGSVYPCHRAASNKLFKLGSILEGNIIRGMFLNIDKASTGCTNCKAWKHCHTCLMTHYQVNKKLEIPVKNYCKLMVVEAMLAHKYLPLLKGANRDVVLKNMATVIADMAEEIAEIKKMVAEIQKGDKSEVKS